MFSQERKFRASWSVGTHGFSVPRSHDSGQASQRCTLTLCNRMARMMTQALTSLEEPSPGKK
jgi:hypothetical protein